MSEKFDTSYKRLSFYISGYKRKCEKLPVTCRINGLRLAGLFSVGNIILIPLLFLLFITGTNPTVINRLFKFGKAKANML